MNLDETFDIDSSSDRGHESLEIIDIDALQLSSQDEETWCVLLHLIRYKIVLTDNTAVFYLEKILMLLLNKVANF
jgi:hypothetical protein